MKSFNVQKWIRIFLALSKYHKNVSCSFIVDYFKKFELNICLCIYGNWEVSGGLWMVRIYTQYCFRNTDSVAPWGGMASMGKKLEAWNLVRRILQKSKRKMRVWLKAITIRQKGSDTCEKEFEGTLAEFGKSWIREMKDRKVQLCVWPRNSTSRYLP